MKIITRMMLLFAASLMTLWSCGPKEKHFISDEAYRNQVKQDFEAKKELMNRGDLFSIFNEQMTAEEREAMEFLYAYMPLNDIADYDGQMYLDAVRLSFQAREEMPWGKDIPEREFRHFVLPLRINNENIDSARSVFYGELKDRISNMSLHDAVLEVNHWCHEKVVYKPSDARTSSPLATVKTAFGRCGEESTFAVAAFRAVGIPARQVYTPRWAHTDDNHAWVEAWVDGKWYFLGACEPEPVLNLAWFNAPASRGMLMHTKVFGKYNGPEEVMSETNTYTEINVIDNYAPTSRLEVEVLDNDGKPVKDAVVEYKIYNYAEFCTVAKKYSDNNGSSLLTAGKGDMLVWASKDDMFGYKKVSFGKDSLVQIKLDIKAGESYFVNMDIVPPVEGKNLPAVTEEQREKNNIRLAEEDAIRNKYISTFMSEDEARKIAESMNIDADKFAEFISKSRGNWKTIKDFMESVPADNRVMAMDLLDVLWEKDLRDVTMAVLNDNLYNTPQSDYRNSKEALLTPRVEYEMLTPYKGFLQKAIPAELAEKIASDPTELVRWCTDSISICNEWNPLGYVISPEGIWKSRIADKRSRNVFFVSAARAMGIPSWIDPVTGKIQYVQNGSVIDVDFESGKQTIAKQGKLMLNYKPLARLKDPKYYIHFTISKIVDGRLKLLGYDDNGTWRGTFKNGVMMDEGNYVLTTGTRLANGSVLSNMTFFNIKEGETTNLDLIIRNDDSEVQVIGNFDSESLYKKADSQETTSVIATTGRGYYVVAVLGAKEEPTNHFLKDLAAVSEEFDKWGRSMIMLFPSERNYMNFDITEFEGLPKNITWGLDINRDIANKIISGMELDPAGALPLIIICDTFNRVVFVSQGYNIGTADRMLDVIHKL